MSVFAGTPPFSWVDGTNLERKLLKSRHVCEAMQALKNRADAVSEISLPVEIDRWKAYDYYGSSLGTMSDPPADKGLKNWKAFRHVNHIVDLRAALEIVLPFYYDDNYVPYTISSLLQRAVGRSAYNRTIGQLSGLPYFDGKDLEEILKCIDLLQINAFIKMTLSYEGYSEFVVKSLTIAPGTPRTIELLGGLGGTYLSFNLGVQSAYDGTAEMANLTLTDRIGVADPLFTNGSSTASITLEHEDPIGTGAYIALDEGEGDRTASIPAVITFSGSLTRDDSDHAIGGVNHKVHFILGNGIAYSVMQHRSNTMLHSIPTNASFSSFSINGDGIYEIMVEDVLDVNIRIEVVY